MWTDHQDQTLIELWRGGHSAGQIAKVMKGCTRNAVIGRVHRLRLSGVALPSRPRRHRLKELRAVVPLKRARQRPAAPVRPARANVIPATPQRHPLRVLEAMPPPVVTLKLGEVEPNGRPASLTEICAAACRWAVTPVSPHLFCNRVRRAGSAYCDGHTLKSFQPKKLEAANF